MKLLAIDTSSSACSVALSIDDTLFFSHQDAPMQQAQIILPAIEQIMKEGNISLNQLDALSFGCGPGSFTGVRIATSIMQGIGYALGLPLIPISSLAALAQSAYQELGWKNLIAATDARIQEIYWGAYKVNSQGIVELMGKEQVCNPSQLDLQEKGDWQGVGNAWSVYQAEIPFKPVATDATRVPMASGLITLARAKLQKKEWIKPENAVPTYLRNDVAKKSYLYLDPKER